MKTTTPITVTSPLLPPLDEFIPYLQKIWGNKWLTNNGEMHKELERQLAKYLGVKYISLFTNGTLALITSLQALEINGEVITTPYSFVATSHSILWNKCVPVFVDIEPISLTIDPTKIEAAITEKTRAILPVHVYGYPANIEKIQKIADIYKLKVIYDAAHAFGVKKNGISILNAGDLSVLSFHATKIFSTIEGGAIICHSQEMKHHIDNLKNFGFRGETIVEEPGINAKMNEIQAAYGLLSLKYVDNAISKRKKIVEQYRTTLKDISGITYLQEQRNVDYNYAYFPIFVDEDKYHISRDALYNKLKENGIGGRRYFYPLISTFNPYKELPSSQKLPIAQKASEQVICLPLFPELSSSDVKKITDLIKA